ncbi:MAG TPA: hypothetical protein VNI84_07245, partial [Pyrinomonadaceae bacterium]|nr:hypothetical protein [Pyrinomonadaceae bacterium]
TAIEEIEKVQGKILCRTMKAGLMQDFLEVWTKRKGGSWVQIDARPGERTYEHLIGEAECEYTTETVFDGVKHYLITPNQLAENPLNEIVSSSNAEHFNEEEIWEIINNIPKDAS